MLRGVGTLECLPVPSDVVSEQHCFVWCDARGVHVQDLRSTNGTRWTLPPDAPVSSSVREVTLELAGDATDIELPPAPVEWSSAAEFRARLRTAVQTWLDDHAIAARVELVERASNASDWTLPIGDAWAIRVSATDPAATRDLRVERARAVLWAYVRAQRGEYEADRDGAAVHGDLVLESPSIRLIHRRITQAARCGLHGVLHGESGVGKSALARCFHVHAERRAGPFVATNLAEVSSDRALFGARLFGVRAGAATGIQRDRTGLLHAADRGTLFLDEVGSLPLDVQGVLLQFLDTGEFRRFGEAGTSAPERADVRVVVGSNTDLREGVRAGRFREDLWWRLGGVVIDIPPLRERREDLESVLRKATVALADGERSLFDVLTPPARAFLLDEHPWRGNFREVTNFVRRLELYADDARCIDVDDCRVALAAGSLAPPSLPPSLSPHGRAGTVPPAPDDWSDLFPLARKLLPLWMDLRAAGPQRGVFDLRVLYEEVLRPLCVARALGIEHWDELPRRPDPSYRAMAERLGYADGKTVQASMQSYIELKRLRATLPED